MGGDPQGLAGAWEITERLEGGVDRRDPADDPKYLWFLPDRIITGDEWAAWEMPYVARSGSALGEIDIIRKDRHEPWLHLGIFNLQGEWLRLCMGSENDGVRPTELASTNINGFLLYVARRSDKPLPR